MPGPDPVPGTGGGPGPEQASTLTVPVRWSLSRHAHRLLTLAVAGLGIALVTRRPEFAGAAAPAVLLLAAWRPGRPSHAQVTAGLTAARIIEGERAAASVSVGRCRGVHRGGNAAPGARDRAAAGRGRAAARIRGRAPGQPAVPGQPLGTAAGGDR